MKCCKANKQSTKENLNLNVSKSKVEEYLNKWQHTLRLSDWDIPIKVVNAKWRKSGDIKIDLEEKKAVLMINRNSKCENIEELAVDELLHLKLYGMDQMIEDLLSTIYDENEDDGKREFAHTQFVMVLETSVEDVAKGYLTANGSKKPLSFNRLQKEIDKELE